ncbi:amidohydrolase [Salinisphaera aquimarina]|uniref:Amidohydrolase n=1 Tax=Salinisphaera aquimarina TaxID=2094031 RepID=A0ABV7EIG9_9GAMM
MTITAYTAKTIHTMNPSQPTGQCVAVRGGRVLGVGPVEEIQRFGAVTIDDRYADKVLVPGFVEGHSHALEGSVWNHLYLGYFDRRDPEGQLWEGLKTPDAVQQRLAEHVDQGDNESPLIAWGLDPVYFDDATIDRRLLDAVSETRPIVVIHASLHVMFVNSATIRQAGLDDLDMEGIVRDEQGRPSGVVEEFAAMHPVFDALAFDIFEGASDTRALNRYAQAARREGVTTITDLLNPMSDAAIVALREATAAEDFPVRLVPALNALAWDPQAGSERVQQALEYNHERLQFGLVKLVTDGAIQNFTARLQWPGYLTGPDNGVWNAPPQTFHDMVQHYHQAGLHMHVHTNGDEAVTVILDALDEALAMWPRPDHRHTLQHVQLIRQDQLRRVARLGACLNIFSNHIYYWGDIHLVKTLGYDRCQRLEPAASADRMGITFGIHCDAPVTPISPLFTAWCATTRETARGVTLGEAEKISRTRALEAITLGAAFTLRMDDRIGSLEPGKFADITVLDEDPLTTDTPLKEIGVHDTLLSGRPTGGG